MDFSSLALDEPQTWVKDKSKAIGTDTLMTLDLTGDTKVVGARTGRDPDTEMIINISHILEDQEDAKQEAIETMKSDIVDLEKQVEMLHSKLAVSEQLRVQERNQLRVEIEAQSQKVTTEAQKAEQATQDKETFKIEYDRALMGIASLND